MREKSFPSGDVMPPPTPEDVDRALGMLFPENLIGQRVTFEPDGIESTILAVNGKRAPLAIDMGRQDESVATYYVAGDAREIPPSPAPPTERAMLDMISCFPDHLHGQAIRNVGLAAPPDTIDALEQRHAELMEAWKPTHWAVKPASSFSPVGAPLLPKTTRRPPTFEDFQAGRTLWTYAPDYHGPGPDAMLIRLVYRFPPLASNLVLGASPGSGPTGEQQKILMGHPRDDNPADAVDLRKFPPGEWFPS